MQKFFEEIYVTLGAYLPLLIGGLLILLAGWFVALLISAAVHKLLIKCKINSFILSYLGIKEKDSNISLENIVSKAIYYLLMVFVVIALFQTLGLTIITEPLNVMLSQIFEFIPNILGAGALLAIAWLIATVIKMLVSKALDSTKLDEKLSKQAGLEDDSKAPVSITLANVAYWLIFLLFLPAIIGSLGMEGLLKPLESMLDSMLAFLPNLFGASIIIVLGWFVAKVVSQIVTNLLVALGTNEIGKRVGIGTKEGPELSGIIGTIAYAFIIIPTIIAGLNALKVEAISKPATEMLNTFMQALPLIFGAIVVLAIAYFVGKFISSLVTNILTGIGFNKVLNLIGIKTTETTGQKTPSELVGYIAFVLLMLFATIEAANLMNFSIVAELIAEFLTFATKVLLGVGILALGLYFANIIQNVIQNTAGEQALILSKIAKVAIVILATAMGLQQMGIANDIINLAFGLLLGAIAIAVAISFGFGGREIASRELEAWLKSIKKPENKPDNVTE